MQTHLRTLNGPNTYHQQPMVVAQLEEQTARYTLDDIARVVDQVHHLLGGPKNGSSRHQVSQWVDQIPNTPPKGQVVAYASQVLLSQAGIPPGFVALLPGETPITCSLVVERTAEQGTAFLVEVAVELVTAALTDQPFPVAEKVAAACRLIGETELGPSTQAIVDAAEQRGIPWLRLTDESLVQLQATATVDPSGYNGCDILHCR